MKPVLQVIAGNSISAVRKNAILICNGLRNKPDIFLHYIPSRFGPKRESYGTPAAPQGELSRKNPPHHLRLLHSRESKI
jgi:hypothetical protein